MEEKEKMRRSGRTDRRMDGRTEVVQSADGERGRSRLGRCEIVETAARQCAVECSAVQSRIVAVVVVVVVVVVVLG